MVEVQGPDPAIAAHYAGETGDTATAQRLQRGEFGAGIEALRLHRDADHPPVTGGKIASSRAAPMGASSGT